MNRMINRCMAQYVELYERETALLAVSGYTVEQLTDLFLQGYTITPPIEPRGLAYEFKWYRRVWRWLKRKAGR